VNNQEHTMAITKGFRALVDEAKEFILFCCAGWAEWVKQGAPTETLEQHKARRHAKA
jgi:hypothetical protein